MARAAQRRQAFFAAHPICCFCGGVTPATTEDHVPSRAFFNGRNWPEGFTFPACDRCQRATSKHELLAAMVARIGKLQTTEDEKAQNLALMTGVNNNYPGLLGEMVQSPIEKRKWLREQGFTLPAGQTTEDVGLFSVKDPRVQEAMVQFGRKLFCGLFYLHTGNIVPRTGGIAMRWFTNENFNDIPAVLTGLTPELANPIRANTSLGEQFFYRCGVADTKRAAVFVAFFHSSIALMGFVFVDPRNVEGRLGLELTRPFEP